MPSRMTDEQLARHKAPGKNAQEASQLATVVFTGTTSDSDKAVKALIAKYGRGETKRILEVEKVRNGARPGLLRRLFS